jgi:adenosylmethionine-8-amino-7-oxononanoate aminotransferase
MLDELEGWDREFVWHAFTQMAEYQPLLIERASGCRLIDVHGREYLDGVSSLWCNVHGHRHPRLDGALREQLGKVAHVTSLGMSNPTTVQLAKRLVDLAPQGLRHVFFSGDGSSAVEVAIKMSFQYWRQRTNPQPERTRFVAFGDAYHGDTLGSVSVGGVARFHDMFRPLLFDVLRLPAPGAERMSGERSREQACELHLKLLAETLLQHQGKIAAVVIEPLIQCAAGMVTHPQGFLRGVRELTRNHDILLIADEVATGFGRLPGHVGHVDDRRRVASVPGYLCGVEDIFSRAHVWWESAGCGCGPRFARRVRRRTDAGEPAAQNRAPPRPPAAYRRTPSCGQHQAMRLHCRD